MRRPRITITLKENLIKQLDNIIDNKVIRNRSNAIEYVLEQYFSNNVTTGVIITSEFSDFVNPALPRSLVKIKGKANIEYILESFAVAGLQRAIICTDTVNEIRDYLSTKNIPIVIEYIEQKKDLGGTALALNLLKDKIKEQSFVLYYGHDLVDINLNDLIKYHGGTSAVCSIALTSVIDPRKWGMIKMKGSLITEFFEKPNQEQAVSHLVHSGVFVMNKEIFEYIAKPGTVNIERDVLPILAQEKKLNGYVFDGQWYDIGKKEMYDKAVEHWLK